MKQILFTLWIAIIYPIIVAGQQNPTTWKEYVSHTKKFSVQYPSDWWFPDNLLQGLDFSVNYVKTEKDHGSVSASVWDYGNKTFTLKDYVDLTISQADKIPYFILNESKDTTVNNKLSHQMIYSYNLNGVLFKTKQLFFLVNDNSLKVYLISYTTNPDYFDKYLTIANRIIYSFKPL